MPSATAQGSSIAKFFRGNKDRIEIQSWGHIIFFGFNDNQHDLVNQMMMMMVESVVLLNVPIEYCVSWQSTRPKQFCAHNITCRTEEIIWY